MTLRRSRRFAVLVSIPLLAACGTSPATHFYTLDALPPRGPAPSPAAPLLRVDQVQVPSVLDRPEWVHENAPGQLKVDDFSHWGAPLGQLMHATLVEDLAARLASGRMVPAAGPRPPGAIGIAVDIVSVGGSSAGMTMTVVWTATVLPPPAKGQAQVPAPLVTSHTQRLSAPDSAADPAGYAAGLSAMTADLADDIVAGVADGR